MMCFKFSVKFSYIYVLLGKLPGYATAVYKFIWELLVVFETCRCFR